MLLLDEVGGKDGVEGAIEAGGEVLVVGDGVEGNDADAAVLLVLFLEGVSRVFLVQSVTVVHSCSRSLI